MSDQPLTTAPQRSLVTKFANRFSIEPQNLLATLKATAFRQRGTTVVTNEQMAALLIVADQYGLNPFTKEIFAFADKDAIIPVVSVDGWNRIVNEHKAYDGVEFRYSETMVTMTDGKPCPEWCEAVLHRTDRTRPTVIREYLDEVYIGKRNGYAGPWQTHTKRMLRWKALIQGARIAFGFAGLYDEDEAGRIIDSTATPLSPELLPTGGGANVAALEGQLRGEPEPATVDAEFTEAKDEAREDRAKPDQGTGELTGLALLVARMAEAKDRDTLDQLGDDARFLDSKEDRIAAKAAYDKNLARLEFEAQQ